MSVLREISSGQISSTGTVTCGTKMLGGINIVADGTNVGTVVIRKDTSGGAILFQTSTKNPIMLVAPIYAGTETLYYSITGTGCTAEIYEWVKPKPWLPSSYE